MIFISVPYFVVAVLSQYIFHFKLGWAIDYRSWHQKLQSGELGMDTNLLLPVAVLTITGIPGC